MPRLARPLPEDVLADDLVRAATIDELMKRVEANSFSSCWIWRGHTLQAGYGLFYLRGKPYPAHRTSYQLAVQPIPPHLVTDHLCRVPQCVNPSHLEPVTDRENILRGVGASAVNAVKTSCAQGHPYTPENIDYRRGFRLCRTCRRAVVAANNAKRRGRVR